MKEAQELYCHNCDKYVRFDIDLGLEGNHILNCPNCGHEHCRVVKNGMVTDERWDSRNQTHYITRATYATTSIWVVLPSATSSASSSTCYFLRSAWATSSASWSTS